jgi:RNA polymerase sigma factor (sigma-70 family)
VAAVRDALVQLPPACRRAAVLCLYADMTAPEAAAVLGVSASTVRTHIQRARQDLVATLASDHEAGNDLATSDPPLR